MRLVKLLDAHGRVAEDLRVSLTDRCNLRCTYCMPAEGMQWLPTEQTLTDDEVIRLIRVAVSRLGVRSVRFTGGEPLLRGGLEDIVAATSAMHGPDGRPEVSLTTNGLGLDKRIDGLVRAGLDRVNISVDSLDPVRYARLTRRDRLPDLMRSIEAIERKGLRPLKLNSVIMRGLNEDDILPLALFALQRGHELRFIEQMPIGPRDGWRREDMVAAEEILAVLGGRFAMVPEGGSRGSSPAEIWRVEPDAEQPGGRLGVIASVTNPFCGACDRTRITSDGQVRTCLFARTETDLRGILRGGGGDDDIVAAWVGAHLAKPRAHGIDEAGFVPPERTMSAIGG
ncbi:GTP 3',8-cyclase MoaA [Arachnia propionica]|uniref:GTP 3',8-cyclase n=1 Tax=Arachnia propionica TaxID=1750 RepID=A0A3P1X064_9ACTN|nr:GTP 3',8-cyclase MoaA [Arachnia propionica]RRD51357.1 GTP 3',8-cyclase MoaA [Arachnia propionica]